MRRMAAAGWIWVLACLAAGPLAAQGSDALVLPRGRMAVSLGGASTHLTGGAGEKFRGVLGPENVSALSGLEARLNSLFALTDTAGGAAFRAAPGDLTLAVVQSGYTADRGVMPVRIALGLTSRLTVHAGIAYDLRGSVGGGVFPSTSLGANPDTAANRALLALLGPEFAQLGASPFLPTAGSLVGAELRRRVRARTQRDLNLPAAAVPQNVLQALLTEAGFMTVTPQPPENLALGDVEVGARFQFANSATGERGYRGTLGAAARFATGRPPPVELLDAPWEAGGTTLEAQLWNDLFLSPRFWSSFNVRGGIGTPREVRRIVVPGELLEGIHSERIERREPGGRVALEVVPRYQLTPALTLAGHYAFAARAEDQYATGTAAARAAHAAGLGIGFSTLPLLPRSGLLPFEVMLGILRTITGEPAVTGVWIEGRTITRLWGTTETERSAPAPR
ncbi:hypothetical protein BH23GEM5_BH23GEM5_01740 [soil metagenome]